jgi:hypothetical protein
MKFALLLVVLLQISGGIASAQLSGARKTSLLAPEPGTIDIEDLLKKPVMLKVAQEAPIYTRSTFDQALGSMPAGTMVKLVGLSDTGFRVRGRARHGDVAGWLRMSDVVTPDPDLVKNLREMHQRQEQVEELIARRQVALGMTTEEVLASMGKPNRKSSKLSASGREEKLEYVVYERVPQYSTGLDAFGRPIQTVVYIKVETGSLSIVLKDDIVESIEETKGNPLGTGGIKIIPGPPIYFR